MGYGFYIGVTIVYAQERTMLTMKDVVIVKQKQDGVKKYKEHIMQDRGGYNEKGQRHGYWEQYSSNKICYIKRNYINGDELGFEERKTSNGHIFKYYAR
jgi:hypothetical protein